jgi:uncharacterized protein CbrC (UPF0167 family)
MTYEEAVELLANTLEDCLDEDHAQDAVQEVVEDIVTEYYGWNFEKWTETEDAATQIELEEKETSLEDFMWTDIGTAALIRIAQKWGARRGFLKIKVEVEPDKEAIAKYVKKAAGGSQ